MSYCIMVCYFTFLHTKTWWSVIFNPNRSRKNDHSCVRTHSLTYMFKHIDLLIKILVDLTKFIWDPCNLVEFIWILINKKMCVFSIILVLLIGEKIVYIYYHALDYWISCMIDELNSIYNKGTIWRKKIIMRLKNLAIKKSFDYFLR
jgi:hypothetical protein